MKIENIGTSKVLLKEDQLLKNYGTIKYEYEEDKVKSISDGEKRIENFYDEMVELYIVMDNKKVE